MNRVLKRIPQICARGHRQRLFIGVAVALATAGLVVGCGGGGSGNDGNVAAAALSGRIQLELPAPSGSSQLGTVSLHMVDHSRADPYVNDGSPSEVMVTLWYPADSAKVDKYELAPWMTSLALSVYRRQEYEGLTGGGASNTGGTGSGGPPTSGGSSGSGSSSGTGGSSGSGSSSGGITPGGSGTCPPNCVGGTVTTAASTSVLVPSLDNVDFPITHGHQSAPVDKSSSSYPLVILTNGYAGNREELTAYAEDLASHGYVVATISFPHESSVVEFPDGRVVESPGAAGATHPQAFYVALRRPDAQFVLSQLIQLNSGTNPDAEQRPLPEGIVGAINVNKIGIYGQSLGGDLVSIMMALDPRIKAGINLDGPITTEDPNDPPTGTLAYATQFNNNNQSYMYLSGSDGITTSTGAVNPGPLADPFYTALTGYKRFVAVKGGAHGSFTDTEWMWYQFQQDGIIAPSAFFATLKGDRGVDVIRAYIQAFFDLQLKGVNNHLLDGPSATYPEALMYLVNGQPG